MFVDQAKIYVKGGDGGDGCLAFRREKFVPKGGPSGGDGGKGGDVYLITTPHLNTLLPLRYQQLYRAGRGGHGSGNRRHGKNGEDIHVEVPVGTEVRDEATGELLCDLSEPGQSFLVARGGIGGRGNARFATSTNQAPRRVEPGKPGEEKTLFLELKVLADVGLVGFPNAGKSTLISVISAARPKVGDYPFTTLSPQLGVVSYDDYRTFVVADVPGLIEGAHQGSGLGDQFLRHVERCRLLIHLVDVSQMGPEDPVKAFQSLNKELRLYDKKLSSKPQLLVATKLDAVDPDRLKRLQNYCREEKAELYEISAATGQGVSRLKNEIASRLQALEEEEVESRNSGRDVRPNS